MFLLSISFFKIREISLKYMRRNLYYHDFVDQLSDESYVP